jgi:hypothetical protein
MQDNVLFSGPIAGEHEDAYLRARLTPTPLQGRRRISAYDVIAVMVHESERRTPRQRTETVQRLWCEFVAPSFESSEVLHFNFKGQKGCEEPVLTLRQAFHMLSRLPSTPRIELHRAFMAQTMLKFFADNKPSVAEVHQSPACASLLPHTGMRNPDNEHALRARLADAETALLIMQEHHQHKRRKTLLSSK